MNYLLSENDKKVLTELLSDFRTRRLNPTLRPHPDADDLFPPEVYVAKTPGGGIPAISGTTPGSAVCDVYQLVSGSLVLASGTPLAYPVYNLMSTPVPASAYILVHRDKYGNWFAEASAGGATSALPWFVLVTDVEGFDITNNMQDGVMRSVNINAPITGSAYRKDPYFFFSAAHATRLTIPQDGIYYVNVLLLANLGASMAATKWGVQFRKNGLWTGDEENSMHMATVGEVAATGTESVYPFANDVSGRSDEGDYFFNVQGTLPLLTSDYLELITYGAGLGNDFFFTLEGITVNCLSAF